MECIVFFIAVSTEDLPASRAQALHNRFALQGTQLGIGVYRGHKNGRVLVILRLLFRQTMNIDVNIAGKNDVMGKSMSTTSPGRCPPLP